MNYNEAGLIPAVVQDVETREVLMLAWVNEEALEKTLATGNAWFFSRSRNKLWMKGETSGNVQHIVDVRYDCDSDSLLYLVNPDGPACHTGEVSCFYRSLNDSHEKGSISMREGSSSTKDDSSSVKEEPCNTGEDADSFPGEKLGKVLTELSATIAARKTASVDESYTAQLLNGNEDSLLKKIGEEATEVVMAAKDADHDHLRYETGDLLYHLLVVCERWGVTLDEIAHDLESRRK